MSVIIKLLNYDFFLFKKVAIKQLNGTLKVVRDIMTSKVWKTSSTQWRGFVKVMPLSFELLKIAFAPKSLSSVYLLGLSC